MNRCGDLARRAVPSFVNLAVVLAAMSAMPALAYPGGYTGRTATTSAGCGTCHRTGSGATNVVLSGPASLAPGAVGSYTFVVAHAAGSAPGTNAGVDIGVKTAPNGATDAGTLAATGTDLKAGVSPAPAELTQASAKKMSGTPVQASFAFTWTAPATPGTYTMQALGLATSGTSNGAWSWATPLTITVAAVETSVDVLVPVVLDVLGGGTGRFTTELTLVNAGTSDATAKMTFVPGTASPTGATGSISRTVPAGQQLILADVLASLAEGGIPVARPGDFGSLRVSWTGLSSADAGKASARTTTPYGAGRTGLAYPALSATELATTSAYVFGLKETASDRSNLALVNGGKTGTITLGLEVFDGSRGLKQVDLPSVTLKPGEWTQVNGVLSGTGVENGYVRITRLAGTEPFAAYGVVNDNGTNDGAYLAMSGVK